MPLVTRDELNALRRRGAWYGVAVALAVASVVGMHRCLAFVWPRMLAYFGDTPLLAIAATQIPNLGQQVLWNVVFAPIYALGLFEHYKSAFVKCTTSSQ